MKTVFLTLFVGLMFILPSCSENQSSSHSPKGLSKEEAQAKLQAIVLNLATDKQWLAKAISENVESGGLALAKVSETLSSQLIIEGVDYTVKIGLLNSASAKISGQLAKLASDSSYGVILDPDRFYPEETSVPGQLWNGTSVEPTTIPLVPVADDEELLPIEEQNSRSEARSAARGAIHYPVFTVDIEQTYDDPEIERELRELASQHSGGLGKLGSVTPYFVVKRINLTDKKDNSNDEFEVYAGESIYESGRINKGTYHKFNGNTRNDAASRSVYYRDVNGDQGWENMSNDIALWPLYWSNASGEDTSAYMRILCVEDDYEAGKLDLQDGGTNYRPIDTYRMRNGGIVTNTWPIDAYDVNRNDIWPIYTYDNDDIYGQSGIDEVNRRTVPRRYNTTYNGGDYVFIDESDLDWYVGVREY
jgi:hypothetical protein